MVRTAQWSYLKDSISQGPSLSIHRKGRPWLFLWISDILLHRAFLCFMRTQCAESGVFLWWSLSLARYLFWTEWGQNPCIGRSRLDGSDQVTLVNSGIMWPNGISLDYEVELHTCTNSVTNLSPLPHAAFPASFSFSGCDMTLPKRFLFVIWILKLLCRKIHYTGATPAQIGSRR